MTVLNFNSREEMRAYLIQAAVDQGGIHVAQAALNFGDHWVRFPDLANKFVEFGRVPLPQEVADYIIDLGGTAEDAAAAVDAAERSIRRGSTTSVVHSIHNRGGVWLQDVNKANVWPIEESLFNQASECEWQIDLLPMSGKINLHAAFRALRSAK